MEATVPAVLYVFVTRGRQFGQHAKAAKPPPVAGIRQVLTTKEFLYVLLTQIGVGFFFDNRHGVF
jgi:hypothetical protein